MVVFHLIKLFLLIKQLYQVSRNTYNYYYLFEGIIHLFFLNSMHLKPIFHMNNIVSLFCFICTFFI